jgi:tetratricopeptide (TPR) repeat protein
MRADQVLRRSLGQVLFAAIVQAPNMSAQSMVRGKQLFDDAKYAAAKTELLAVQRVDGRNAAAAYLLGRIATIDNDGDEAFRQFERAVQLEDGNAKYHMWLATTIGDAAQRASSIRQPFMARRVKKEFERAVELDPNQLDARFRLVGFYAFAPGIMGGSMDKARQQAAEIAKLNPMRGALARGTVARYEKKPAAEEAACREAIALGPDSLVAYVALADALVPAGKAADAFATLDDYLKRHPDDRWIPYHTGRVAGATGQQLDRGERALTQFLAAPPTDAYSIRIAAAHYWLGQIAEKRGAKDVAREQYQMALKINPKSQLTQRALDALVKSK